MSLKIIFAALYLVSAISVAVSAQTEVDAKPFFIKSSNDKRGYVYIQLPPDQVLVFRSQDSQMYYLQGRALTIRARKVRLDGKVILTAFKSDDHGADHTTEVAGGGSVGGRGMDNQNGGDGTPGGSGYPGLTGATGDNGPSAQPIRLFVSQFEGVGDWGLVIDNSGAKGGHGGRGGTGGAGGRGGQGRDADSDNGSGDAGRGGDGGLGGKGGTGGKGGDAAIIEYPSTACSLIASGRIVVKAAGGGPGDPGDGGFGGPGGSPGDAGSGAGFKKGGHGANAGADHRKVQSATGDPGQPGNDAQPVCRDCKNHTCVPHNAKKK